MNRYGPMLLLLAAVWGASYLLIKVAVEDIEPAPMMAVRTLLLDEEIGFTTLLGLALILGGVALASGKLRLPRREVAAVRP